MKNGISRVAFSLIGAVVFLMAYKLFLVDEEVSIPVDAAHLILLSVSAIAACMVGSSAAILLYNRFRGKS